MSPRLGRPPASGQPVAPPEYIVVPEDCDVSVEGRIFISGHDRGRLTELARLEQACNALGLTVLFLPPDGKSGRRQWVRRRTSVDIALADLKGNPGMTFIQWTERNFMDVSQLEAAKANPNNPAHRAAKGRAQVALHRMFQAGRLEKHFDVEGNLRLCLPGANIKDLLACANNPEKTDNV